MALEVLATPVDKHPMVLRLLQKWQKELTELSESLHLNTPEYESSRSLARELTFRAKDSLRNQVQELVRCNVPDVSQATIKKAVDVYDKRSKLVHEGTLPGEDLEAAEKDAREIVELVLNGFVQARSSQVA